MTALDILLLATILKTSCSCNLNKASRIVSR